MDKNEKSTPAIEKAFLRISIYQTVLAVVGMFIACIALFAALNEADSARKQQTASVLPELVFAQSFNLANEAPRFSFIAVNNGIGPARVRAMRLSVGDTTVTSWREMTNTLGAKPDVIFGQSQIAGRLIPSAETITVFETTDSELVTLLVSQLEKIKVDLCYCSVF
ncbi:MAG: hypothetical protein AAF438_21975, partial [Pseudomonadota bacterium]